MDMRNMRGMDGRRLPPRNSRGEFRRRRSYDRGMDYARGDMNYTSGRGGQPMRDYGDMRGNYNYDMARQVDMRNDYARQGGYDGHYPQGQMGGYRPIETMGYFNGYYGMPEHDYARGGRRDYGYDMRGGYDYGYDYENDYGSTLSEKEMEDWCYKLKANLNDHEKQMFSKEMISQKAKQMGRQMQGFGEKELEVVTLMLLDDYKKTLGANPDTMVKLAFDWLDDKDAKLKGAEKLAVYYDEIVMGGEE